MTINLSSLRKDYRYSVLDEQSVSPDPVIQFSLWLQEALDAGIDHANAMILSTADPEGNVSARVVLLKGAEQRGFTFFTNYQSKKGLQLAANPKAALTFLWIAVERQVRIEGVVSKVSRKESVAYFNSRPADNRVSACVSPQSAVIPDRSFLEAMKDGVLLDLGDSQVKCPEDWGGYVLKPTMIEFWQGREGRLHDRLRYRMKRKRWILERLAP